MPEYALTIKNNRKDSMMYKEDFELLVSELFVSKGITVGQLHYELDSSHVLHIHTSLVSQTPLIYKNFMRKGWHIYIRRISTAMQDWIHYTMKEPRDYYQLLQDRLIAMSKDNNLFINYDL